MKTYINTIFTFLLFSMGTLFCSPRPISIADELKNNKDPKRFSLTHKRISDSLYPIGQYEELEELTLNFNAIESLPSEIGNLKNLKKLHVYGNALTDLPEEFSNLSSLKHLVMGRNPIQNIPNSLRNLPELKILALDDTKLTLSEEDVEILATLRSLEILDLSDITTIATVPKNIEKLSHINNILLKKTTLGLEEREKMAKALPNTRLVK